MEEQFNKEAKDGDLRRVQQELLRKRQEMRIACTRQEELWWQLTAT